MAKRVNSSDSADKSEEGSSVPHLERTAGEPRDEALIPVVVQRVDRVNDQIRLFRLGIPPSAQPVKFLAGQWLDVYCPGVSRAGGFTLTSSPTEALPRDSNGSGDTDHSGGTGGYLELAVQNVPKNPPAAWLWQDLPAAVPASSPPSAVVGREIQVRVGGKFTYPPPASAGIDVASLQRVVFVAGGVGINPLVCMLSYIAEKQSSRSEPHLEVDFLYSVKDPLAQGGSGGRRGEEILFLDRVARIYEGGAMKGRFRLFLTGSNDGGNVDDNTICMEDGLRVHFDKRRITVDDVVTSLKGKQKDGNVGLDKEATLVYVCGVPGMTDEFVRQLTDIDGVVGMPKERVLCERWW